MPVEDKTVDEGVADEVYYGGVNLSRIRPNVMDELDSPNPVWTWYMMEEKPFLRLGRIGYDRFERLVYQHDQDEVVRQRREIFNNLRLEDNTYHKVIIASSGRTDEFAISNVSMTSYLADQGKTTSIDMDVVVPQNSDLYDHMFQTARFLGIRKWNRVPMLLDLQIRGNDPYTGLPKSGPRKIFLVQLTTSGLRMDETGTSAKVSLRNLYDTSHGEGYDRINEQVNIKGKSPGTMLRNLMLELQKQQQADLENGIKSIKDEFTYYFSHSNTNKESLEQLRDAGFSEESAGNFPLNNVDSENTGDNEINTQPHWADGNLNVTYLKGDTVFSIIYNVLLNSPYLIAKIKQIAEYNERRDEQAEVYRKDGFETAARAEENQKVDLKEFFHLETQTDILGFDYTRNDYAVRNTYVIHTHRTPFGYARPGDVARNHIEDRRKLKTIEEELGIFKRYDHLFTGLNQQVLALEWDFENLYFNQVASRNEILNQGADVTKDTVNSRPQESSSARALANSEASKSVEPGISLSELNRADETAPVIMTSVGVAVDEAYGGNVPGAPDDRPRIRNYFAGDITASREPVVSTPSVRGRDYVPDRQLTAQQQSGPKIVNTGITAPADESANLLKRYFNSAWVGKYAQKTSDMITVRMSIRGDPFYLPDLFDDQKSLEERDINPTRPLLVMIKANQPAEIGDDGFVQIKAGNTLNAIYQVVSVAHSWSENSWTSELDMRMEQGTDVNRVNITENNVLLEYERYYASRIEAETGEVLFVEPEPFEFSDEELVLVNPFVVDAQKLDGSSVDRTDRNGGGDVFIDTSKLNAPEVSGGPRQALKFSNGLQDDSTAEPGEGGEDLLTGDPFPEDLKSITLPVDSAGHLIRGDAKDPNIRRLRFTFDKGKYEGHEYLENGAQTPRLETGAGGTPIILSIENPREVFTFADSYSNPDVHTEFRVDADRPDARMVTAPYGWSGSIVVKGHTWLFEDGHDGYPFSYSKTPDAEPIRELGNAVRRDFFNFQ